MGNSSSTTKASESTKTDNTKFNDTFRKRTSDDDIYRLAIDQSATIGSLYNAIMDCLLKTVLPKISSKYEKIEETVHCTTINRDELQGKSLSDLINVDKELCLSVTLNMTPSSWLSSLLNYSVKTDIPTRILCYYYTSTEQHIINEQGIIELNNVEFFQNDTATHVITAIRSGVAVIAVLQLSSDGDERLFSGVMEEIKRQLTANIFNLTKDEQRFLTQFVSTKAFSNIPNIAQLTKLTDIGQKIIEIKKDISQHLLLEYILKPIQCFCSIYPEENASYVPLNSTTIDLIKERWHELSLIEKPWKISIDAEIKSTLEKHIKQKFIEVQQQISKTEEMYSFEITKIPKTVCVLRSKGLKQDSSNKVLVDSQLPELLEATRNVIEQLNALIEKAQLINRIEKQKFKYWNVKQIVKDHDDNWETIVTQLVSKDSRMRIFCFDDKLENPNSSKWNEFYKKLSEEHKNSPRLEFIYADFSYCSYRLQQMETLSSKDTSTLQKSSREQQSSNTTTLPSNATPSSSKKIRLDSSNQPTIKFKNVLLLGESGVGKSTFINAIVNYLTFESLEQVRSGEPIVLMPVSFLITVGDTFEEKIVRFGDQDPNEDHNQSGQSVTQHCRSYVFKIGTQTKIRLIDTPGMGDTRGLDQDDRNMQHILSYINNLSHLDAICILLKPNEARLNVVLRSYFTRLLGFLGANVRNNIIFCFTNTRATFFAPGNTGPLLRKMLESHSIKNIPFKKANTFCFDSESFRYLVALLNGIEFDDYQEKEYKQSWMTSVNESNRLLQYISRELKSYPREDWQSMEHAYFQITQLIRPMLETIRNTMRNVILLNQNFSKSLIKLHATPVLGNSGVCLNCKNLEFLGRFWIIPDKLHVFSNQCNNCPCDLSQHSKVDYVLTYELWTDKQKPSSNDIKTNLDRLEQMMIGFVSIFKDVVHISQQNDPILAVLNRIIAEEMDTCSQKGRTVLNSNLCDELKNLRKQYEKTWTTSSSHRKLVTLPEVYKQIKKVSETDTISQQLEAIKQTQKTYMDEHEKQIS